MSPESVAERVKRLRLPMREVAKGAGCGMSTAYRILSGYQDPHLSTLRALERTIVAKELELRDYLCGLHGVPQRQVDGREAA